MKRALSIIAGLLIFSVVDAQTEQTGLLENLTEFLIEQTEEEPDVEELTDTWEYYLENRIKINSECTDELRQLRFLTEFQIQSIVDYKKQHSPVLSIYELTSIDGINRELLENLQSFLDFGDYRNAVTKNKKVHREILIRTTRTAERAQGYFSENGYLGSPEKYYLRFNQTSQQFNFGLTAEKDPGETFFKPPNQVGFDFYSMCANYQTTNEKFRFYMGDYIVHAGQGLVIWQGFASGKSAEVSQVYRSNQGIRSYTSADENRFLRGVACEFSFKNASLFLFQSRKKIDANMEDQNGSTVFTSFQTSGLHRTNSEIEDKHAVTENVSGLVFSFQKNNFSLGFNGLHVFYDKPRVLADQPYQLFLFQGKQLTNISADYKWSMKKIFLFGETACNFKNGFSTLSGALLKPVDQLELSLVYRNFGKKYNSIFGQAFSESTAINDEQGFYTGLKLWPVARFSIAAYHDIYYYHWLKYQTASPSEGTETMIQLNYSPSQSIEFYTRYFIERKESQVSNGQLKYNETSCIQRIRFNLDFQLNEQWSLKSRAEFSHFEENEHQYGMLFLQDLKYKSLRRPFSCQLRFAWFDTDNYSCRLYAYENDMLHNFSVPALSGKGVRSYLNGKYTLSQKTDLWFKIARTQYFELTSIGSGLNEIKSDCKTEFKFQIRFRF